MNVFLLIKQVPPIMQVSDRHSMLNEEEDDDDVHASDPVKQPQNACSKVSHVVHKILIPLLYSPIAAHVSFRQNDEDVYCECLQKVHEVNPQVLETKDAFILKMASVYDTYMQ
jgi:hypothetical protein